MKRRVPREKFWNAPNAITLGRIGAVPLLLLLLLSPGPGWSAVLGFEPRPLVSTDFIGNPLSSVVDADQTQVVGDDLVEVQSWYDNEWGFSNRMIDLTRYIASKG